MYQLAPERGMRRMAARAKGDIVTKRLAQLSSGSFGHPSVASNDTRDHRYLNNRLTADEQLEMSLNDTQWRSRELFQTSPHAHGAIEARIAHEIGVGLSCRPKVTECELFDAKTADQINLKLKDVCRRWSMHGVDRRRRHSLGATQRMVARDVATFGEAFAVFREAPAKGPIGLTVELIDPMRVETPAEFARDENVRMGIRYHAKTDQIIGYYVRVKGKRYDAIKPKYEFIRRYDKAGNEQIVHVFEALLPEQSRGVPWLCAAFALLKDLDDFHEAELVAKQIEACFGLIIKTSKKSGGPMSVAEQNWSGDTDSEGRRLEDIYPGMIEYVDEDGEITKIDPSRPGSTFAPFIEAGLRAVSAALNFPYEILAKNFHRTTYSSGRLAMLDGKLSFEIRRQPIVEQFCNPLWRRLVAAAFFFGHLDGIVSRLAYIAAPHLFEDHAWGGQSFGAIDPNKEIEAHRDAVESNQETLAEIHAEHNQDWEDVLTQRDREIRKETDLRLAREKDEMDARTKLGLPMPGEGEDDGKDAVKARGKDAPKDNEDDDESDSENDSK
ncbi:phage portal protein [Stieleria sp. JC731]|nr:phage portal protein [Stieleria sp. JC731]MCC9603510.1 phage portal protein [Stieleria sp. JC731]